MAIRRDYYLFIYASNLSFLTICVNIRLIPNKKAQSAADGPVGNTHFFYSLMKSGTAHLSVRISCRENCLFSKMQMLLFVRFEAFPLSLCSV